MEKKQTHILYGFLSGIAMVIVGMGLYLAGIAFKPGMKFVPYVPFLIGIILNAMAYSKANDGYVTFGNVFGSGFKCTMIVTLVMVAWGIISNYALPDLKIKALEMINEQLAKTNNVTDEQRETAMKIYTKFWVYMIVGISILSNLFYGALFSLVGGAIAKKKGERPVSAGDNF